MNDSQEDEISPDDFVDGVLGYLKTAALKGALDLDLFSAIPETDGTAEKSPPACRLRRAGCAFSAISLLSTAFFEKKASTIGSHRRRPPS